MGNVALACTTERGHGNSITNCVILTMTRVTVADIYRVLTLHQAVRTHVVNNTARLVNGDGEPSLFVCPNAEMNGVQKQHTKPPKRQVPLWHAHKEANEVGWQANRKPTGKE